MVKSVTTELSEMSGVETYVYVHTHTHPSCTVPLRYKVRIMCFCHPCINQFTYVYKHVLASVYKLICCLVQHVFKMQTRYTLYLSGTVVCNLCIGKLRGHMLKAGSQYDVGALSRCKNRICSIPALSCVVLKRPACAYVRKATNRRPLHHIVNRP